MDPGPLISTTTMKISFILFLNNDLLFVCVCMNVFPTCVSVDHIHD